MNLELRGVLLRVSALAVAVSAMLVSQSAAAPVASFDAYAESTFSLLSARFVGAPGDAYSYVSRAYAFDIEDSISYAAKAQITRFGVGGNIYSFDDTPPQPVYSGLSFGIGATVTGSADGPGLFEPSSDGYLTTYAYPAYYFDDAFCAGNCDAVSSVELTFDYALSAAAEAAISKRSQGAAAEAAARASIAFGIVEQDDFFSQRLFFDEVEADASVGPSLFDSARQDRNGTFSLLLRPGEYAYADVYLYHVRGSATVPQVAPVPLPAGMSLLGLALTALGLPKLRRIARREAG